MCSRSYAGTEYYLKGWTMSEEKKKHIKVTYSTLASPDPLLHQYFDEAVAEAREGFGQCAGS